jgi:hypothetical protein
MPPNDAYLNSATYVFAMGRWVSIPTRASNDFYNKNAAGSVCAWL